MQRPTEQAVGLPFGSCYEGGLAKIWLKAKQCNHKSGCFIMVLSTKPGFRHADGFIDLSGAHCMTHNEPRLPMLMYTSGAGLLCSSLALSAYQTENRPSVFLTSTVCLPDRVDF